MTEQGATSADTVAERVAPAAEGPDLLAPWLRYALAVVYGIIMLVLYRSLSFYWAYLGFDYVEPGVVIVPLVALAATPALILPTRPRSMPQFACWLLFFILFLPALIIPHLQGWVEGFAAVSLFFVLLASVFMFIGLARMETKPFRAFHFPREMFWIILLGLWALFHGAIYFFLSESLQLAGIGQDVYDQRQETAVAIGGGPIIYLITNASSAINPLLVAIGFAERKWWAVGLGLIGQILVYATLAGKIVLIFPLVIIGTFFLFKGGRLVPMRLALAMVAIAIIGIPLQLGREQFGDTAANIVDLVYMRTLYLPGVLVGAYNDFFSIYPLTFFSHSIVGRLFVEYPYGIWSVGQVVGSYVTPRAGYGFNNYNANFIASDGIASLGVIGIPVMMLVAILVLRLIDKIVGNLDLRIRCAALLPLLMWIADGSLTTALLTGGGILATLLLWLYSGTIAPESDRIEPS